MKNPLRRFTAGLFAALSAAVLSAPAPAQAGAPAVPAGLRDVAVTHERTLPAYAFLQHRVAYEVDAYDVTLKSGTEVQNFEFSERNQYGYIGALRLPIDPCAHYIATVTPRNAAGQGSISRIVMPSHLPGGIRAGSVKRNNSTTATFTWSPPTVRGTHFPEYTTEDTQLFYELKLVTLNDGKVVQTGSIAPNRSKAPMSYRFSGLAANRSYALRVTTSSYWGSCADKVGRIQLPAVR